MDKIRKAEESGKLGTKLTNRTLRKLTSNKLAVFGVILFVAICVLCFAAPLFTSYEPTAFDLRAKIAAPTAEHIMGTDQMGRDIWTRMLCGGRISIIVGLGSALGAALVGVTMGLYMGYKGGWIDSLLMKASRSTAVATNWAAPTLPWAWTASSVPSTMSFPMDGDFQMQRGM